MSKNMETKEDLIFRAINKAMEEHLSDIEEVWEDRGESFEDYKKRFISHFNEETIGSLSDEISAFMNDWFGSF